MDRFTIKYGTGTAAGRLVSDTLMLAEPPLQLPDQKFGLATEESPDFDAASCDGILVRPTAARKKSRFRSVYHCKEYACVPERTAVQPHGLQLNPGHGALRRQGLALPGLSKASGGRPGFWHMLDLGILDARMFSLWLNPDVSELAAGEIRFGGADPSRRAGDLVELPVVSDKCAARLRA